MTRIDCPDVVAAEWIVGRIGRGIEPPYTAMAFGDGSRIEAAALFNDYQPGGNIEMTFASDAPFTRGMFREIARYVFGKLGCCRLTIRTKQNNDHVCDLARRLGFVRETTLKDYFGRKQNAELFRLLKKDCRWL